MFTRILRYPGDWPTGKPEEKGIDVQLAIDFVMLAVQGRYDAGILFSGDTDLKPALEAVTSLPAGPRVEVAAWSRPFGSSPRLSIKSRTLWCHWLDQKAYNACHDPTDYTLP